MLSLKLKKWHFASYGDNGSIKRVPLASVRLLGKKKYLTQNEIIAILLIKNRGVPCKISDRSLQGYLITLDIHVRT